MVSEAEQLFNDLLGDMGSYAEWGHPQERSIAIAKIDAALKIARADQVERDAKVAEDAAEGSRVLHNLASKDRDRDGVLVHGEAWRSAKEIARAIRQKGSDHEG